MCIGSIKEVTMPFCCLPPSQLQQTSEWHHHPFWAVLSLYVIFRALVALAQRCCWVCENAQAKGECIMHPREHLSAQALKDNQPQMGLLVLAQCKPCTYNTPVCLWHDLTHSWCQRYYCNCWPSIPHTFWGTWLAKCHVASTNMLVYRERD